MANAHPRTNIMQQLKNGTFNQMKLYDIIYDLEACLRTYISKNPGKIYLVNHDSSLYISNEKFSNDYRFDEIPHISFHKMNINHSGRHPVHIRLDSYTKIPLIIDKNLQIMYAYKVDAIIQKTIKETGMEDVLDILNKNLLCIEEYYAKVKPKQVKPKQVKLDISHENIKKITNKFIKIVKNENDKISKMGTINSAKNNLKIAENARHNAILQYSDWEAASQNNTHNVLVEATNHLKKLTEETAKSKQIKDNSFQHTITVLKKIKTKILKTIQSTENVSINTALQKDLRYVECAINTINTIMEIQSRLENFNFNTFKFCNNVYSDGGGASKGGRR